jgi:hypothetical protein
MLYINIYSRCSHVQCISSTCCNRFSFFKGLLCSCAWHDLLMISRDRCVKISWTTLASSWRNWTNGRGAWEHLGGQTMPKHPPVQSALVYPLVLKHNSEKQQRICISMIFTIHDIIDFRSIIIGHYGSMLFFVDLLFIYIYRYSYSYVIVYVDIIFMWLYMYISYLCSLSITGLSGRSSQNAGRGENFR